MTDLVRQPHGPIQPLADAVGTGCPARYDGPMQLEFTAVFRPVPGGFVAFVEELPGANTQGSTLAEARANLEEAVRLVPEANRALAQEDTGGAGVIREPLTFTA
jgi:predicted RNase H-like HicB family nuclease